MCGSATSSPASPARLAAGKAPSAAGVQAVDIPVGEDRHLTAEISTGADGRHAITVSRFRQAVRVPAIKASKVDALATAVMLALGEH
jgi:hypothetical protein